MAHEASGESAPRTYRAGAVSLWSAIGFPVVGVLVALPSGTYVLTVFAVFVGGMVAALAGQFAISDARLNGDPKPGNARVGRCLGWLEVAVPLVLAVLFLIALSQAQFVW